MKELGVARPGRIRAIQPHDVELLILHPDAAQEAALSGAFFRGYVKHDAADVALELAVHIFEIVMGAVKVVTVGKNHPGKTNRLVFELEQLGEPTQHAALKACFIETRLRAVKSIT